MGKSWLGQCLVVAMEGTYPCHSCYILLVQSKIQCRNFVVNRCIKLTLKQMSLFAEGVLVGECHFTNQNASTPSSLLRLGQSLRISYWWPIDQSCLNRKDSERSEAYDCNHSFEKGNEKCWCKIGAWSTNDQIHIYQKAGYHPFSFNTYFSCVQITKYDILEVKAPPPTLGYATVQEFQKRRSNRRQTIIPRVSWFKPSEECTILVIQPCV